MSTPQPVRRSARVSHPPAPFGSVTKTASSTPSTFGFSTTLPATSTAQPIIPPQIPQAQLSTYPSRLRTGSSLLFQPINLAPPATGAAASTSATAGASSSSILSTSAPSRRRAALVNYADQLSEEDEESDYEEADFPNKRLKGTPSGSRLGTPGANGLAVNGKPDLDKSYLGLIPPSRFITSKPAVRARHEFLSYDDLEAIAQVKEVLVPIRVELETETHRIHDVFMWNLNEDHITPETFAKIFCQDVDLPFTPFADQIAGSIKAQLEEHAGVASFDIIDSDDESPTTKDKDEPEREREKHDCRVILSLDVQINTHHLLDHIEWDLAPSTSHSSSYPPPPPSPSSSDNPSSLNSTFNPNAQALPHITPESFAKTLCSDLGLSGETVPLVSHALHEEILKHKKDAIEWGVLAPDGKTVPTRGLGRASQRPGPWPLLSVWRDWEDVREFGPRVERMSVEEMERREVEREREMRRVRRETSRFQRSAVGGGRKSKR